jgi:crossover junction endodeoxyribonuclease RuvC
MLFAGIDPGKNGAIVYIENNKIVKQARLRDVADIYRDILSMSPHYVAIEKAQSYPKQGIASAFNYGQSYGILLGVLIASGITYTQVSPAHWHRFYQELFPTALRDKQSAYLWAKKLWPMEIFTPKSCRKPHDGIIDAALLAHFGATYFMQ